MPQKDEHGNDIPENVKPPEEVVPPSNEPVPPVSPKGALSEDEVNKLVAKAVADALEANRVKTEEDARIRAAAEQGNYKELFEEAEKKRKTAELNLWRGQALQKYGLDDEWFDSLAGETHEAINASAKDLKRRIDKQVDEVKKQFEANHPVTPPAGGGQHRDKSKDSATRTGAALAGAFGVRTLPKTR